MASTDGSRFHRLKGLLKGFMGWATADREVEAEGRAETEVQARPAPSHVHAAQDAVRQGYGETEEG